MKVVFLLGSESDKDFAGKITKLLDEYNIDWKMHIASAHKVPEMVFDLVSNYNNEKKLVYITIAGRSNGLSGVTAANSVHPVIACPPFKDKNDMIVNINSTLMMPSDTPVMAVLDPKNAALAAIRILSNGDGELRAKVENRIKEIKDSFVV